MQPHLHNKTVICEVIPFIHTHTHTHINVLFFSCSMVSNSVNPWIGFLYHLLELAQTHVHRVSDALQPSPLLSPPPAFHFSKHQGLFQWVTSSHQVGKVFSFSISPSNDYSGLISFRIDWLDLLAVQGTLKSLFQHHSAKASVLWCSPFFMVQFSHPYMTTGKTKLWLYGPLLAK